MPGILLANRSLTRVLGDAQSFSRRLVSSERDQILATASPATLAHIQAVEAADGQELPIPWLQARVNYANWRIPLGGQSLLLSGTRTLLGALVPLVGPAPTGVNLVSGDYNGLYVSLVDSGKYIATNRNNNVDLQNNRHISAYVALNDANVNSYSHLVAGTTANGSSMMVRNSTSAEFSSSSTTVIVNQAAGPVELGTWYSGRQNSSTIEYMVGGVAGSAARASGTPISQAVNIGANASGTTSLLWGVAIYSSGPYISPATLKGYNDQYYAAIVANPL